MNRILQNDEMPLLRLLQKIVTCLCLCFCLSVSLHFPLSTPVLPLNMQGAMLLNREADLTMISRQLLANSKQGTEALSQTNFEKPVLVNNYVSLGTKNFPAEPSHETTALIHTFTAAL